MQEMSKAEGERLARSCATAEEYPLNLAYDGTYDHILKGYSERLDEQEDRLFFDESKANLCLRDYDYGVEGWFYSWWLQMRGCCIIEMVSNRLG